jgi:uncharacterized protein YgbK (DUF1537 family)
MTAPDLPLRALAASVADAACLAAAWGPAASIGFGEGGADICAPAGETLTTAEIEESFALGATQYLLTFGNTGAAIDAAMLGPVLDIVIAQAGTGFCAACLAAPQAGRTVYQGHLFQRGVLRGNLLHEFSATIQGRAALVPLDVVAAGPAAIIRQLAALKEQGVSLALLDAVAPADQDNIAAACAGQTLLAGPAWMAPRLQAAEPAPPGGPAAILSGALDRETLYQLGVAATAMPRLQLDFSRPDVAADAAAWVVAQTGGPFIIAASAPPDRVQPDAAAAAILGEIACRLRAAGVTRFVITGGDTAAAVIAALGLKTLRAGAAFGPFRWLEVGGIALLLKPGDTGERDFFIDLFGAGIGPQLRLNAAAE